MKKKECHNNSYNTRKRGRYMKIAIGNDHSAVEVKKEIMEFLISLGHEPLDCGYNPESGGSTDYPIYAERTANAILNKEADCGILICGTGVGISIAANKINGIRAVACSEPYSARLAKQHNNANILAFGARVVGIELAKMIVMEWLNAEFQGGRHQRRIDLITEIEERNK